LTVKNNKKIVVESFFRYFKYGRKKSLYVFFYLILVLIITVLGYLYLDNRVRKFELDLTRRYDFPYVAVYNAIADNKQLEVWNGLLKNYIDSAGTDTVFLTYDGKKYILSNDSLMSPFFVEKGLYRYPVRKLLFKARWKITPVYDTMCEVKFSLSGKFPFVSPLSFTKKDNVVDILKEKLFQLDTFLVARRNKVRFIPSGSYVTLERMPYLYTEHPYDGSFFETFSENFAGLLIYAISSKIYDFGRKSFLVFYPLGKKNEYVFVKYRNAAPVKSIPGDLPEKYRADTLERGKYFSVIFTGDYDLLTTNLYSALRMVPDTVRIKYDAPVLMRFLKGHSVSNNPGDWRTQILFPVK
jgi:hypothetical protein